MARNLNDSLNRQLDRVRKIMAEDREKAATLEAVNARLVTENAVLRERCAALEADLATVKTDVGDLKGQKAQPLTPLGDTP